MDVIRLPAQLGAMLRAVRMQQGITQADVAKQLDISVQAVSKLEANAGRASFDRVHRLCLLLGLELVLRPIANASQKTDTLSEGRVVSHGEAYYSSRYMDEWPLRGRLGSTAYGCRSSNV